MTGSPQPNIVLLIIPWELLISVADLILLPIFEDILAKTLNPFIYNVEKWPDIL